LADCAGRLKDTPKLIKAEIFPFDDDLMAPQVDRLLSELAAHKERFISRYEIDGARYIQVNNFAAHQHLMGNEAKSKSKFPAPPAFESSGSDQYVLSNDQNLPGKFSEVMSTTDIRSNGVTEERKGAHAPANQFSSEAIEGEQYLGTSGNPNIINPQWARGFLDSEIGRLSKVRPEMTTTDILKCWRAACDAASAGGKTASYLRATFEGKCRDWKAEKVGLYAVPDGFDRLKNLKTAPYALNIHDNRYIRTEHLEEKLNDDNGAFYGYRVVPLHEYVPAHELPEDAEIEEPRIAL